MAGYLICVSYESGVPIFARRIGDVAAIPFPLAASMNGVSIFGKANKVDLISTLTESGRVCWKDYKERISLIFVGSNDSLSDIHHNNLLDNIYNVIVFHIGVDEIKNISNLDKLKRDCRRAYPVIDKYLYGLNPLENTLYFGDITLCADVCLQSEIQTQFQCLLEPLLENIGCGYGAIIVNGIIMAASKDWWFLKGSEICIITFVASQPSSDRFSDFPVFLPISSPKLPYRLIVSRAKKSNIQLVILCGQEPESSAIQLEIKKWKHSTKEIFNLFSKHDHPPSINTRLSTIDPSMLGFFVINNDKQRCAFSILHEGKNQTPDATSFPYRLDILRTFYRTIVGSVLSFNGVTAPDQGAKEGTSDHRCLESYWTSEYHKCHAVQILHYQLFVLYNSRISFTAMRCVSQKLLNELTKDKVLKL